MKCPACNSKSMNLWPSEWHCGSCNTQVEREAVPQDPELEKQLAWWEHCPMCHSEDVTIGQTEWTCNSCHVSTNLVYRPNGDEPYLERHISKMWNKVVLGYTSPDGNRPTFELAEGKHNGWSMSGLSIFPGTVADIHSPWEALNLAQHYYCQALARLQSTGYAESIETTFRQEMLGDLESAIANRALRQEGYTKFVNHIEAMSQLFVPSEGE